MQSSTEFRVHSNGRLPRAVGSSRQPLGGGQARKAFSRIAATSGHFLTDGLSYSRGYKVLRIRQDINGDMCL